MSQPPAKSNPDVSHDLGKLLKGNPHLFLVHKIYGARILAFLQLELDVVLASHDPAWANIQFVKIKCINAVDYALRPKPSGVIEGGMFAEYYEEHPQLQTVSQCVPHTDGMKYFNPPIQFRLLFLEDTWVIAQRFELFLPQVRTLP
jgi:hypothetical protein